MLRTLKSFLQPSDEFVGTRLAVEGRNVEIKRLIASGERRDRLPALPAPLSFAFQRIFFSFRIPRSLPSRMQRYS
jgi:hypothetical protein